jgi:teichuronic acid biosynthesis protein TuaE
MKIQSSWIEAVILILLITGSITGAAIYIKVQQLQFFRISVIISLLWIFIYLLINKKNISLKSGYIILFAFFIISFVWMTFVSIFTLRLDFNSFVNYIILLIFLFELIFFASKNEHLFLKVIYYSSIIMFIVMLFIASWEFLTFQHLEVSTVNDWPQYAKYTPSTFFTNPNDFSTILVLIVYYMFIYEKIVRNKLSFLLFLFIIISIVINFLTNSRISLLSIFALIVFYFIFIKNKIRTMLFIFTTVIVLILLLNYFNFTIFENFINTQTAIDVNHLLEGLTFGGESTNIRKYLYLYSIYSITQNFGLGMGLNNSSLYFDTINDPRLGHIINPHSYLFEILINGGVFIFTLFFLINIFFLYSFLKNGYRLLIFAFVFYYLILFNSSSSIFLWYHYIFYVSLLTFQYYKKYIQIKEL